MIFEGKIYSADKFKEFANLSSREELLAQLVGGLSQPMNKLVGTLSGAMVKLIGVLNGLRKNNY